MVVLAPLLELVVLTHAHVQQIIREQIVKYLQLLVAVIHVKTEDNVH